MSDNPGTADPEDAGPPDVARKWRARGARMFADLSSLDRLRKIILNLLVVVAVAFLLPPLVKRVRSSTVVVRSIAVPPALEGAGLGGAVISQHILDKLAEIGAGLGSRKERAAITSVPIDQQLPSINLPVAGLNVAQVIEEIRSLLGYADTLITGEITAASGGKDAGASYVVRLRVSHAGVIYESPPTADIGKLVEGAAAAIMQRYDPINLGFYYYRKKDYEGAYRMTEVALADQSSDNDGWAFSMRGLIARDENRFDEAVEDFAEAVSREPKFAPAWENLATSYRLMGRYDEAETAARKAIEVGANDRHGWSALGLVQMARGDIASGIDALKKAVDLAPNDHQSHFDLAQALARTDQREDAAKAFSRAVEIKPDHHESYVGLSSTLRTLGRQKEALVVARRAADRNPGLPEAWLLLGNLLAADNRYADAAAAYRHAVGLPQSPLEARLGLAGALAGLRKPTEARAEYELVLRTQPRNADALAGLARVYGQEGDRKLAAEKLREALSVDPKRTDFLDALAAQQESQSEFAEAAATLQQAVQIDAKLAATLQPRIDQDLARAPRRLTAPAVSNPAPPITPRR